MSDKIIDDLRLMASRRPFLVESERLHQIADEYERMKHDLERHVEIAATIGDVEETAYRQGWLDGSYQMKIRVRGCIDGYIHLLPVPSEINERLKGRKGP